MRLLSLVSFVAIPAAVVALTTLHFVLRSSRRTQVVALVRRASDLSLTTSEAGRFAGAVERITMHFTGRDVREPPPEIELALACHPGTTLRLEYRPDAPHYAAVVLSGG